MSDPLDEALRALADAQASPDFAARVRARLDEAPDRRPLRWKLTAVATTAVLIVAFAWYRYSPPALPERPALEVRNTPKTQPAVSALPEFQPHVGPAIGRPPRVGPSAGRIVASTAAVPTTDHERALTPLPSAEQLQMSTIAPTAVVVSEQTVVPLAPIAPLAAADPSDGDRGGM